MSANNFWNNFSHGFMHGMFNSNPFMCSNMFYPNLSVFGGFNGFGNCFGGFGNFWGGGNCFSSLFTCPTYMNSMTMYPSFMNTSSPVSIQPSPPQDTFTFDFNFDDIFKKNEVKEDSKVNNIIPNNEFQKRSTIFDASLTNEEKSNNAFDTFEHSNNTQLNTNSDNVANASTNVNANIKKPVAIKKSSTVPVTTNNANVYTMKITDRYTGTAEQLNKVLGIKNGVLKGKGQKFLEMQEKYGLNAAILAAICCNESGYGTSNLACNYNNVCGYSGKGAPNGFKKFNSVDECIEAQASLLKRNYVDKGLVTVHQIHMKYCPPKGDKRDTKNLNSGWGSAVASITKKFESYV